MKVPFNDLKRIHEPLKNRFHEILDQVLDNCSFIGDTNFSEEFSKYPKPITNAFIIKD